MRWEDVNTQWKGIQIKDKVEGARDTADAQCGAPTIGPAAPQ